jgi:hypothetical protein
MDAPNGLPKPEVRIIGRDGNAFAILGACTKAMKKAGWKKEDVDKFLAEAMSGDYDHLLQTAMKWCEVS